jgi:hypothetical protein
MPALRPLLIFKGDSRPIMRRWKSGGKSVDLTGCEIELVIEDGLRGSQLYLASVANGKLDSPGDDGVISGEIPAADTAGFDFESAYHRLIVTFPSGTKTTLTHGPVQVK